MTEPVEIRIRIHSLQQSGHPVEITLNRDQQLPGGVLDPARPTLHGLDLGSDHPHTRLIRKNLNTLNIIAIEEE